MFITGGYLIAVLHFAAIYAIFVTGLNIFMGYAGQVSFGHNAFAAISGYTSAVLTANHGWEPLPAAALGLSGALAGALVVGYPTLRLRGHYLAMATLGDRPDRLRSGGAMAVGDTGLHGHLRHPSARHRRAGR